MIHGREVPTSDRCVTKPLSLGHLDDLPTLKSCLACSSDMYVSARCSPQLHKQVSHQNGFF